MHLSVGLVTAFVALAVLFTAVQLGAGTAHVQEDLASQQERAARVAAADLAAILLGSRSTLDGAAVKLVDGQAVDLATLLGPDLEYVALVQNQSIVAYAGPATSVPLRSPGFDVETLTWTVEAGDARLVGAVPQHAVDAALQTALLALPEGSAVSVGEHRLGAAVPQAIAASAPVPGTPWTVTLEANPVQIAALRADLINGGLMVAGVLALLAATAGVLMAQRMSAPIVSMQRAAGRMAGGDLDVVIDEGGSREIRDLCTALNTMARNIRRDRRALLELHEGLEREVDARTEEAEEGKRAMELFFYGVGHDLKTPVITTRTHLQLLARSLEGDHPGRPLLDSALLASDDMRALLDQLLEFANAGQRPIDLHPLPVVPSAGRVLRDMMPLAEAADLHIVVEGKAQVLADQTLMERMLRHMVGQAVDRAAHTPHASQATLELAPGSITLRDNALPFDAGEDMFLPFGKHRHDGTTPGFGLRLALVRRAATRMGGTAHIYQEGGRTCLRVQLPCAPS